MHGKYLGDCTEYGCATLPRFFSQKKWALLRKRPFYDFDANISLSPE
jgi:hypothetical protein